MDPGVSLFAGGAEQLQLDTNAQHREEEDEAVEDQRRRDQELDNLLTNAFDDLIDEEEEDDDDHSSVGSSRVHGATGHGNGNSNIGSFGSSHDSPSDYYSYSHGQIHIQTPQASVQQYGNSAIRSPGSTQPLYDPSQGYHSNSNGGAIHETFNGHTTFQATPILPAHSQYRNGYDAMTLKQHDVHVPHDSEIQRDADNFGYLSSIPQAEFSHNGALNGDIQYGHSLTDEDLYRQADLNSQTQLMVLYGARVREVKQLTETLEALRFERDSEVDQLKRKMMLLEADKQGAFLSHKEAQNLLVDCKSQLSKLQQEVEDLRLKNVTLEKSKEELAKELDIAKASSADLVQKVAILERNGNGLQSEKQMESYLKTVQQRHESQLRDIQEQLDSLTTKFNQKNYECNSLERKLRDAHRSYEALILEKGETVNGLVGQLEESQRLLRSHVSSPDGQETIRLQVQLEQALADRKKLEEQLLGTTKKLEAVEKDLQQYEAVNKLGLFCNGDSSFETDSITQLGMSRKHSTSGQAEKSADGSKDSTRRSSHLNSNKDDLNQKLRDELHRALKGHQNKREEIRRLQEELSLRDQKIKAMKEQEKIYYTESEKFKKTLSGVLERLKHQEEEAKLSGRREELEAAQKLAQELQQEKNDLDKKVRDTQSQLEKLKAECSSSRKQVAELQLQLDQSKLQQVDKTSAEFLAFHDESISRIRQESSRQLEAQVVDFRVRMEQAQKECEEVKRLYIEVCSAKRALLTRLQEEESSNKTLRSDLKDVKEALQSLEELHEQERQLSRQLRGDLEKERVKVKKVLSERDEILEIKVEERVAALSKEQELRVADLEKARNEALARAEKLQQRLTTLEKDSSRVQELETECAQLRSEAIEAPQRQQAELERISRELKQSRERVIQLEKRLRAEFQTQMEAITSERDSLQAQLKLKNNQLEEYLQALSRIRPPCREVSTNTTATFPSLGTSSDAESLQVQVADLKSQLESAEKSHNIALHAMKQHLDEKVTELNRTRRAYEQKLGTLQAQHKDALAQAEEQVKEETVRYFAEEIARLEDKHRDELDHLGRKLVDTESAFVKHLTSLKNALQEKTKEVENLRNNFKNLEEGKSSPSQMQLHLHVSQLKEQIESDRNKMAEVMSEWASEVQEVRSRESAAEAKLEEIRTKYKTAKKAALHYKKMCVEKEKHMMDEWRRLESGYREALSRVQAKVGDIVGGQEREVADHLNRIESHYEAQIRELASKLNQKTVAAT